LMPQILGSMAENDPAAASRRATELPPNVQEAAMIAVVNQWANTDPQSASRWAAGLAEGKAKESTFSNLVGRWAPIDSTAAENWIRTLPHGQSRDTAVMSYVRYLTSRNPKDALQWTSTIDSESIRRNVLEPAAASWLQKDRAAATAWINTSALSDEVKQRLLNQR